MDRDTRSHFGRVIDLVFDYLSDVVIIQNEITSNRAILEIHAQFGDWAVRLKEIRADAGDSYAYYALRAGRVIIGFDNYADLNAIKAKYGRDYRRHLEEQIPHKHSRDKQHVELTDPFTAREFIWSLQQMIDVE